MAKILSFTYFEFLYERSGALWPLSSEKEKVLNEMRLQQRLKEKQDDAKVCIRESK